MKKLLKIIWSVIVIVSIMSPHLYAGEVNAEITTENEHLTTIFDNALILVRQIKNKTYDEKQRTISIKNIDKAYKKLSFADRMALEEDVATIKEESQGFSSLRKQPQKYSSVQAEKALQNMGATIQMLVESRSEEMISQVQQQLNHAINKTEKIIKDAQKIIQKAQEDLMLNRITSVDAARIIGEQNYSIGAAQRALKKEMEQATDTVVHNDEQTSYFNQFVGGVYSLTSRALAPFKSGYGYTPEEQEKARAIIMQLEQQLATIFDTYDKAIDQPHTPQEHAEFNRVLEFIVQEIVAEINQQKIITGEVMSTKRKLFWGTVAVAGTVVAGLLGYKYFATPTEETPKVLVQQPAIVPTKQEVVKNKTSVEQEKITAEPKSEELAVQQKSIAEEEAAVAEAQVKRATEEAGVKAKIEAAMAEQKSIIKKQEEAAEEQAKIAADQAAKDAEIEAEIDEQTRIIKEQQQKEADKQAEERRLADEKLAEQARLKAEAEIAEQERIQQEQEVATREAAEKAEQEQIRKEEEEAAAAEAQVKRATEEAGVKAKIEAAMAEQESIIKKQEEAAERQAKIAAEQATEDARIGAEIDEQTRIIKEQQQKEADKQAEERRLADEKLAEQARLKAEAEIAEQERIQQEQEVATREAAEKAEQEQIRKEEEEAAAAEQERREAEERAKREQEEAEKKAEEVRNAAEQVKIATAEKQKKKSTSSALEPTEFEKKNVISYGWRKWFVNPIRNVFGYESLPTSYEEYKERELRANSR